MDMILWVNKSVTCRESRPKRRNKIKRQTKTRYSGYGRSMAKLPRAKVKRKRCIDLNVHFILILTTRSGALPTDLTLYSSTRIGQSPNNPISRILSTVWKFVNCDWGVEEQLFLREEVPHSKSAITHNILFVWINDLKVQQFGVEDTRAKRLGARGQNGEWSVRPWLMIPHLLTHERYGQMDNWKNE